METTPLLEARKVTKRFPGTLALNQFDFSLFEGEVHALLGENGAGKSTFIKIVAGIYQADEGQIWVSGRPVHLLSPKQAEAHGVGIVHQDTNLVPFFDTAENVYLGVEARTRYGLIDRAALRRKVGELQAELGLNWRLDRPVGELTPVQARAVVILKALARGSHVFILDEPTAALSSAEAEQLFRVIHELKRKRVGIIYVSHRLRETTGLADRVTILKDGQRVGTFAGGEVDVPRIVELMSGRRIVQRYIKATDVAVGDEVLRVSGLTGPGVRSASFAVRAGEIVGVAGLTGSGRTELVRLLFGLSRQSRGSITMGEGPVRVTSPGTAMRLGMALVPEDRRQQGLISALSVAENVILPLAQHMVRWGVLNRRRVDDLVKAYVDRLNISLASVQQPVNLLSGGNQQKVVLARCLALAPRLFLLDEPTYGVDAATKYALYGLFSDIVRSGAGILLVSSDFEELAALSDRVLVLRDGAIQGELQGPGLTERDVLLAAAGG